MKKRIVSVLLGFLLIFGVLPGAAEAAGGFSGFSRVHTYQSGHFTDVATPDWYTPYVQAAYEFNLIDGTSLTTYAPGDKLTIAEAVKLAACLHSIYSTGTQSFPATDPWYGTYVDYALKNGIIAADYTDYTVPATRSEFALILSKALPAEALAVKNSIGDNAIPDVPDSFSYAPAVYELYRAGVLIGSDTQGHFMPNNDITRAEVAAIVVRMADASYRQELTLNLGLTTEQIFKKCSPAVFYVEIYDINDKEIKTGSGFFLNSSGLAVTNFHVINGAAKAKVTTADGKEYDVAGVYDSSKDKDLALIQVSGDSFPFLLTADSSAVVTGADAYAIGSPLGFKNTISKGIISSATRDIEGKTYIQTTAAISAGSSGGALLDGMGRVVGVTTATANGAQNINLALPINMVKDFKTTGIATLKSILPNTVYYVSHYPVPDFGAFAGAPVFQDNSDKLSTTYYYKIGDMSMKIEDALDGYVGLLEDNTFQFYGYAIENGKIISYYINGAYGILMTFGEVDLNGTDCIRLQIM